MEKLSQGCLAYFDSASGLVPCRVLRILGRSGIASTAQIVFVLLTASRKGYSRGETIKTDGLHVVPRKAVDRRSYRLSSALVRPQTGRGPNASIPAITRRRSAHSGGTTSPLRAVLRASARHGDVRDAEEMERQNFADRVLA